MRTDKLILTLSGAGLATLVLLPELYLFASGIVLIAQAIIILFALLRLQHLCPPHCRNIWRRDALLYLFTVGATCCVLIWLPELFLFFAGICMLSQGWIAGRSIYLQWTAPNRPVTSILQMEYRA